MTDLDRDRLIALLERLGGSDDKDVLAAGREIARSVNEAGKSWDKILAAPNRPADPEPSDPASEPPAESPPSDPGEKLTADEAAQAAAEIAAVLAIKSISDSTRSEIEDLRGDLAQGKFGRGDLRYVRALRARIS